MSKIESKQARDTIISNSKTYIGTPYLLGGIDMSGIDCSGLIYTVVLDSIGYELPRNSSAMYASVKIISDSQKEPGDLLFFRTTGSGISHVALYLGNNQFIHAASDGPNTGVIVSSLQEAYWKSKYEGIVGRFLPPTTDVVAVTSDTTNNSNTLSTDSNLASYDTAATNNNTSPVFNFVRNLSFDVSGSALWSFFSPNGFKLNLRGGSVLAHIEYTSWEMQPGLSFGANFEAAMDFVQFPILFTVSMPYGFRVYFGPVLTLGYPTQLDTKNRIYPSIFPGIIGASWQTTTLKAGPVEFALAQDIYYTIFNQENGSALPIWDAFTSGLVFSTGIRVILPFSNLF